MTKSGAHGLTIWKTFFQVDGLFRDCEIDEDGMFDYKQLAHIMKYGNPEE